MIICNNKFKFIIIVILFYCIYIPATVTSAEDDPHADYINDINTPANAKTDRLYEAWGENMSELIESGHRKGIIINGENQLPPPEVVV